jgi:hypothetical protein
MHFAGLDGRFGVRDDHHNAHEAWTCSECKPVKPAAFTSHVTPRKKHLRVASIPRNITALRYASARQLPAEPEPFEDLVPDLISDDDSDMADEPFSNHYATLGLPVSARLVDIRKAYREHIQRLDDQERLRQAAEVDSHHPRPASKAESWHAGHRKQPSSLSYSSQAETLFVLEEHQQPDVQADQDHDHQDADHDNDEYDALHWQPSSSEEIIARNSLDDAYSILAHAVKRKAYDRKYWYRLQYYEGYHINQMPTDESRAKRVTAAKKWRTLAVKGPRPGVQEDVNTVAFLGWTARHLNEYNEVEKSVVAPASRIAGEAVADFVDGMEL